MRTPSNVFLDSAYAIALVSPRDTYHKRAQELSLQLEAARTPVVTTRAVMLEIGNALSAQHLRPIALQLLDALEADHRVEIISLTDELYADAYR